MKKIIVIIIILITGFLITFFIPIAGRRSIKIAATAIKISMQLNNPDSWKTWNPDLKNEFDKDSTQCIISRDYKNHNFKIATPSQSFSITSPSGNFFEIIATEKNKSIRYKLFLTATSNINSTEVFIETDISLFDWIFSSGKYQIDKNNFSNYLKVFMENDSLYYGFPIQIRKVADTNVVVLNEHVPVNEKFSALNQIFEALHEYIDSNQLTITAPPMLQYNDLLHDSVSVLGMFAVNKQANNKNKIRCMKMPARGRMLVGYFKGKFKDRIKLKSALQQYLQDKNIVSIVNSYEKYLNGRLPENEDSAVEIEIYFPIL